MNTPYRAAWPLVMCVVGLDYFSSLAYQPSAAVRVAGSLAPAATAVLVFVTLAFAVPLYYRLAARSPAGDGSIGLLERLVPGWIGKLLVLFVLGAAAVDLVFARTFSAADAAEHLLRSPFSPWQSALDETRQQCESLAGEFPEDLRGPVRGLGDRRMVVTLVLLLFGSLVAWIFRTGVTQRLIRTAVVTVSIYLLVTGITVGSYLLHAVRHPEIFEQWCHQVQERVPEGSTPIRAFVWIVATSMIAFPRLALGMSGFELTLASMPLVHGEGTGLAERRQRIRATRRLLLVSALIMSAALLASTFAVTLYVPDSELAPCGAAADRATAYLAHGSPLKGGVDPSDVSPLFGPWWGALHDVSAAAILTLSGVAIMIGMRDLVPPYLYRLGMDWEWSKRVGLFMYLFTAMKLLVTYATGADLDAQRGAYLTGVLSLFTAASATALGDVWKRRESDRRGFWYGLPLFGVSTLVFASSTLVVARSQPIGFKLAALFVAGTTAVSIATRFFRNTELRFQGFVFANAESENLWNDLIDKDYSIVVPIRPSGLPIADKERIIREHHRIPLDMPVVFIEAELGDVSEFSQLPILEVVREDGRIVAKIARCVSIPHAIAAAALEISKSGVVPEIHFGWSDEHPLTANLNFVLFGQGNIPWMVYELVRAAKVPDDRRPRVIVG